jgi:Short C-terminal domain
VGTLPAHPVRPDPRRQHEAVARVSPAGRRPCPEVCRAHAAPGARRGRRDARVSPFRGLTTLQRDFVHGRSDGLRWVQRRQADLAYLPLLVPLWKSTEEREAEQSERSARLVRVQSENAELIRCLEEAVDAADAGDPVREEKIVREVMGRAFALIHSRAAERSSASRLWHGVAGPGSENAFDVLSRRVLQLEQEKKIRRGQILGFVGDFVFYSDRILTKEPLDNQGSWASRGLPMTKDVAASVETAGSITTSRRPTLTRMAAGSILPGSALIPGFAFAKKETFDSRELYFILEHPEGGAVVKVNPDLGQVVREVAVKVNMAAAAIGRADQARESGEAEQGKLDLEPPRGSEVADTVAMLKELVELRDAGELTTEEFEAQKARLLRPE